MPTVSIGADWSHANPTKAHLDKHGIEFACRYLLDDARDQGKALKLPEARQLSLWGRTIVANFEYATEPNLTFAQGAADARTALAELIRMGAPRRVVYFSFDYDAPAAHFPGCMTYLQGAGSVLGMENVGAYGHFRLVEYLAARGIRWLWQCYAWSAGRWSAHATVRQVRNGAFPGDFAGDLNHAQVADIGQWTLNPTPEDDMDPNTDVIVPPGINIPGVPVGAKVKAGWLWLASYQHIIAAESADRINAAADATRDGALAALVQTVVTGTGGTGNLDTAAVVAAIQSESSKTRAAIVDAAKADLATLAHALGEASATGTPGDHTAPA